MIDKQFPNLDAEYLAEFDRYIDDSGTIPRWRVGRRLPENAKLRRCVDEQIREIVQRCRERFERAAADLEHGRDCPDNRDYR